MLKVRQVLILLSLVLSLFTARFAGAQGGATGAISGAVVDVNGGAVPGADVQIVNTATDALVRRMTAGDDGSFEATLMPPATYYVVVNKSGFAEAKAANIEVRVTETTRLTIPLKPGTVTEKVEISAQVASVETTNATTGQTIGTDTVRELPLATQNYQQLLTLSTGVQSDLNASAQLGRGVVKIFVNGQREDNNNYLIEGISATDYNVAQSYYVPLPNPDVIQEFKVQTSLYDASQGRNGGGNVNAILRTGTSQIHGDAYEFFRNDALNANEYFHNAAGQARPSVKQNIFGVSVGGPVIQERYGFFFVNYQGTRQRSALSPGTQINNPGFPVIPTDRSEASISQAFFNNTTTPIDPVVLKLLQFKSNQFNDPHGFLIPSIAGTPGSTGQLLVSKTGKYTDDQFTTNWDREFRGGQDKIGARFFFSDAESLLPFGAGGLQASLGGTLSSAISATDLNFPYDIPVSARFFSFNETHLFTPTLVNDFRFGFVRINDSLVNKPPVSVTDLGINRPTSNITQSIYKFTLNSSGFQIGPTPPADQFQIQNIYNFVDTLSWVKGAHDFRFGGEAARINLDKQFPQTFNGQLFFTNTAASPTSPIPMVSTTDFQNFLLGAAQSSFGGGGVYHHKSRANDFGFFAQDDWRVKRHLTLNLGLRIDVNGAFHDNDCHIGNIDESLATANKYPMIYGGCVNFLNVSGLQGSGNDTTLNNNYAKNVAPRIGMAYDIGGHNKTVVRAGYGIYYAREDVGNVDQLSFQAPFLPIVFGGSSPGGFTNYFAPCAASNPLPYSPYCNQTTGLGSNPNALPPAKTLSPAFIPCQSVFTGFNNGDSKQAPNYGCAASGPGSIPTEALFVLAVPRRFVSPSTQQWNLTIQRDLGKQWILEVGYVGTHTIHLRETRTDIPTRIASPTNPITGTDANGNPYTITVSTLANGPIRSANPQIDGYNGFQIFDNSAYSHYHSLQTTVSRRWSRGYFQAAYTYSRSLDVNSTGNTAFNTAFNDETNLRNGYGPSDFDRPHRLSVSYRYELPFFSGATGWKHVALGGWSISGITTVQSGTPFSIIDSAAGSAYLGLGYTTTLTGELASGGTISKGYAGGGIHNEVNNGYLNVLNFAIAPALTTAQGGDGVVTGFGNIGRNTYRGPYQQNWDFSLMKNFQLTERAGLRFTTDFFNIWNHANFANPSITDVETAFCTPNVNGCPSTGRIPGSPFGRIFSTVGTPRLIQFSLRLSF